MILKYAVTGIWLVLGSLFFYFNPEVGITVLLSVGLVAFIVFTVIVIVGDL